MRDFPNLEKFRELLNSSGEILIAVGGNSNFDILASSLAFYLSLSRMGKKVTIVSPKEPLVEEASLVGIDKISSSLGGKNLVISVKDALGSVEKVTHYLEGDKLNIVVHPLAGVGSFSQDKIELSYGEQQFNLIVLFEVPDLALLEKLYTQDKDIYSETEKVFIGKTHIVGSSELTVVEPSLSVSEITSSIIAKLKMPIDGDIGGNLFHGIRSATNGFEAPPATAETFELASFCLKAGVTPLLDFERTSVAPRIQTPPIIPPEQQIVEDKMEDKMENKTEEEPEDMEPEPDWFTPKIYKSSKDLP